MGTYSSSPEVEISSTLISAYMNVDCLATERLGRPFGRVGDDVATGVEDLLPGLVRPVGSDDDVARWFNAVNLVNTTVLPSSSSYDNDRLKGTV